MTGLVLLLLTAAPAPADEAPATVLSLHPLSLLGLGVQVQAERYLADNEWSALVGLGARVPVAGGDFRAVQLGAGGEVRRWVWRGGPWTQLGEASLGGLFLGARVEAGWRQLETAEGRPLGSGTWLSESLHVGYRALFFPAFPFEVTPSLGVVHATQWDAAGRTAPLFRLHTLLGLTVGWVLEG